MLIKKGISTYDYVTALRDQEQLDTGVQQSPQMSPLSSPTRLSSTSSFNIVNRGTWCTPPRLFVENQFDVIPPQMGTSKKILGENQYLKRNTGKVKLNPWTLARLDAEEISKSAAQARMKSRTLRPIVRQAIVANQDADNRFDGQSDWLASRIDCQRHGATMSCGLLPDFPHGSMVSSSIADNGSEISLETPHLAPLQLEARTAFRRSCVVSPVIGLHSPELHLFRLPSCGSEEAHGISSFASSSIPVINSVKEDGLSSDGYEASGGEDSDLILPRIGDRTLNRTGMLFESAVSDMENNRLSWSWASSSTGLWGNDGARF